MVFVIQWWMYLLAIVIGLLAGALLVSIGYFIHSKFQSKMLKKKMENMPKDKTLVSQWLKQDNVKKVMMDGGTITQLDEKEAEQDERERFEKFREFEKLRRFDQRSSTGIEFRKSDSNVQGRSSVQERSPSSVESDKDRIEFE